MSKILQTVVGLLIASLYQILSAAVVLLWIVVASRTVVLAYKGSLFVAPCLKDVKEKEQPPTCQVSGRAV